jgi:phytoene desaturase
MRAQVARIAPDDLPGYERFLAKAREICAKGFEELGDMPFGSPIDMLRIAPDLLRLEGYRSVHGLVSRFVKHPKLRTMLSFHPLLIGGNPFRAPAIYCLIPDLERRWGVHYPMGGVNRLVDGLVDLIHGQGGTVRLGADVARILVEGRRACGVALADGERIDADIVVSDADAAWACSSGISAPAGATRTSGTTPSCWARATRNCFTRSSSASNSPTISPSTCTARPPPTRAWRRPAATGSTRYARCPTWMARRTGRPRASGVVRR